MPIPDYGCSEPQLCCDVLWDNASNLLDHLWTGMQSCLGGTDCGGNAVVPFVSLGRPQGLMTDYLAVWFDDFGGRYTSGDARGNLRFDTPAHEVAWRVQLSESNYPIAYEDDGQIYTPDPAEISAAARVVYSHGEQLYRLCLQSDEVMHACSRKTRITMVPALPGNETLGGAAGTLLSFTTSIEL
jgi:hypothetical protein